MTTWQCSVIYASPTTTAASRLELWDHLMHLRNNILEPELILGDFNKVKNRNKISGGAFNLYLLSRMGGSLGQNVY